MKSHGYKGTIIWGKFIVYAAALGVADKVLEELKKENLITEKEYSHYNFVNLPSPISSSIGTFYFGRSNGFGGGLGGGGGGSFGGGGGGGIGGGGGGGR
jgi:uncharacterized membrane protein